MCQARIVHIQLTFIFKPEGWVLAAITIRMREKNEKYTIWEECFQMVVRACIKVWWLRILLCIITNWGGGYCSASQGYLSSTTVFLLFAWQILLYKVFLYFVVLTPLDIMWPCDHFPISVITDFSSVPYSVHTVSMYSATFFFLCCGE